MNNKISISELKDRIRFLENKRDLELVTLREQFHLTYESLRPVNILKSTFRELTESKDLKENMLDSVIGLAGGYVAQKLFTGFTHNPIRLVLGKIIQFGVANVVSKNTGPIKNIGNRILDRILKKSPDQHYN